MWRQHIPHNLLDCQMNVLKNVTLGAPQGKHSVRLLFIPFLIILIHSLQFSSCILDISFLQGYWQNLQVNGKRRKANLQVRETWKKDSLILSSQSCVLMLPRFALHFIFSYLSHLAGSLSIYMFWFVPKSKGHLLLPGVLLPYNCCLADSKGLLLRDFSSPVCWGVWNTYAILLPIVSGIMLMLP